LEVVGRVYAPTGARALAATALTVAQWSLLALALAGDRLFAAIGVPAPPWLAGLQGNKVMAVGLFFLLSQVASRVASTGAFEVFLDGAPLHSTLRSGRVPSANGVLQLLAERGVRVVAPAVRAAAAARAGGHEAVVEGDGEVDDVDAGPAPGVGDWE
jgi:selT/selW/selH-like putative selenoprotein